MCLQILQILIPLILPCPLRESLSLKSGTMYYEDCVWMDAFSRFRTSAQSAAHRAQYVT